MDSKEPKRVLLEMFQKLRCSILLCLFLASASAAGQRSIVQTKMNLKGLGMIWPLLACHFVCG